MSKRNSISSRQSKSQRLKLAFNWCDCGNPRCKLGHEPRKQSKPTPPLDLWAQMDKARDAIRVIPIRPEGSFTSKEYAEKYKVSCDVANVQLRKMQLKGLLTKTRGGFGKVYYKP